MNGCLLIDGTRVAQTFDNDLSNRLASNLRLATPQEEEESRKLTQDQIAALDSLSGKSKSVTDNFSVELLSRLVEAKKDGVVQDPVAFAKFDESQAEAEAKALVGSLVEALEQVKQEFGVGASNEIMANILINTEENLSAGMIAVGFTDTLRKIAGEAAVEDNPQSKSDIPDKIDEFLNFLNGENEEGDAETAAPPAADVPPAQPLMEEELSEAPLRLTQALNQYFEVDDTGRKTKIFTEELQWGYEKSDSLNPDLTVEDMGPENINLIADHIRQNYDNEEAVQYLENLSEGDNFFDAIETLANMIGVERLPDADNQVSDREMFANFLKAGDEESAAEHIRTSTARFKEGGFVDYLNTTVKDMVNEVLNGNFSLKSGADFKQSIMDKGVTTGIEMSSGRPRLFLTDGKVDGLDSSLLGNGYEFTGWSAGANLGDSRTLITNWNAVDSYKLVPGAGEVRPSQSEASRELADFHERVRGLTAEDRLANYDELMRTYDEIRKKLEDETKAWQDQIAPVIKLGKGEFQTKTGSLVSKIA